MDELLFDEMPGFMDIAFVAFGVLFVAAVIFIIVVAVRNARAAKNAGYDPLTMQTDITAQVMRSELMRPAGSPQRPLEERLAELDDLHARGVISDDEHATARASALAG